MAISQCLNEGWAAAKLLQRKQALTEKQVFQAEYPAAAAFNDREISMRYWSVGLHFFYLNMDGRRQMFKVAMVKNE